MKPSSRRRFLKRSAALVPALTLAGRVSARSETEPAPALRALADLVLPQELGAEGLSEAVARFVSWQQGFEPVAELDHPYLSSDEIRYGPADPRPLWRSQLEALELEAEKRHGRHFAELSPAERERLVRRQLPERSPQRMMHPSEAPHVALALMAWFFASSEANDLCYGAAIGRYDCRGLPGVEARPELLAGRSSSRGGR